jgi:hypothetical protein
VIRNREPGGPYEGAYVLEIPLVGIEDEGTFEVSAEYAYEDVEDGTGWRIVADGRVYPPLQLPLDSDDDYIGIVMQCSDPQGEACTVTRPDPDGVEIPDIPDVADAPDAVTDPDVTDLPSEPDAVDDPEDVVEDPGDDPVTEPPEDPTPEPPDDSAPEPPDDVGGDDSGD